ncbi:hypothetical protein ASG01_09000 [Chryseobacterium sp. Leaf180]|nr:hypothetical protein ASG01_09000 [Chryseobacterium sp. Leaf180]
MLSYFVSCEKEKEKTIDKAEANAKTFFYTELSKDKNFEKIDTVKLFKKDSLTELNLGLMVLTDYNFKAKNYTLQAEEIINNSELENKINDALGSSDKENIKKSDLTARKYLDSANRIQDNIGKMYKGLSELDKVQPIYYANHFEISVKLKNGTIRKDTAVLYMDRESDIVKLEDLTKKVENKFR